MAGKKQASHMENLTTKIKSVPVPEDDHSVKMMEQEGDQQPASIDLLSATKPESAKLEPNNTSNENIDSQVGSEETASDSVANESLEDERNKKDPEDGGLMFKNFDMPPPVLPVPKKAVVKYSDTRSEISSTGIFDKKQKPKINDKYHLASKKELKQLTNPPIPYKEPVWSGIASDRYYFEVLKHGCIKDVIELSNKPYYTFGRLESCDIVMDHPSISRYHAVVQYRNSIDSGETEKGFYMYDVGSTHGTYINKTWIQPKAYHRLRVGYIVKFGGSTRLHILQVQMLKI